jgi:hypothetical protein
MPRLAKRYLRRCCGAAPLPFAHCSTRLPAASTALAGACDSGTCWSTRCCRTRPCRPGSAGSRSRTAARASACSRWPRHTVPWRAHAPPRAGSRPSSSAPAFRAHRSTARESGRGSGGRSGSPLNDRGPGVTGPSASPCHGPMCARGAGGRALSPARSPAPLAERCRGPESTSTLLLTPRTEAAYPAHLDVASAHLMMMWAWNPSSHWQQA